MALEGPHIIYARKDDDAMLAQALRLAREVEALLGESAARRAYEDDSGVRSTRIVRAMAAGLVDELQALVHGTRRGGVA